MLFIGLPRQEWPSMLSRSLLSLELVQKFESLSWSQTSNKYRQRENLIKVWSCKEDELSLHLTMSWSKRASGTKTRPDVLKPGLECSPNILLPTEVRQLVEMMKILIRLLNKMAPILVATLSVRHGYKMRWHVEQTNGCGERVRCLQICCDERRMACAILLWALLELNERGVKYYSW